MSCGAPVVTWLCTRAKNGRTRLTNYSSYSEMPAEPEAGIFSIAAVRLRAARVASRMVRVEGHALLRAHWPVLARCRRRQLGVEERAVRGERVEEAGQAPPRRSGRSPSPRHSKVVVEAGCADANYSSSALPPPPPPRNHARTGENELPSWRWRLSLTCPKEGWRGGSRRVHEQPQRPPHRR